jgi:hypothetical protein
VSGSCVAENTAFSASYSRNASYLDRVLVREKFLNCSISLVDSLIGVCGRSGVGIRDGDPPQAPAGNLAGTLAIRPIRVPQRVVLISVSVWPPIDCDRLDVSRWIEAATAQHAGELVPDISLKRFECCREQFVMSCTLLLPG